MKKMFKILHIRKITFFEVWETQFLTRDPTLGNVIGSHYDRIVVWEPTDLIGIAISKN